MSKPKNKMIVIVGATASGKTNLAIELAKKYDGEVICTDSRTVYRGLDIGTAKPTKAEQAEVTHHLLDIKEPNEQISVVEFKTLCEKAILDIQNRGKLPILVGGSGMYIDSVLYNYRFRTPQKQLDMHNMTDIEVTGLATKLYPAEMAQIDGKNIRRMRQLLERGPSSTLDRKVIKVPCIIIGLVPSKPILKHNIEVRTKAMLNNGFVQEVESIRKTYGNDNVLLQTTGYKQVCQYLDQNIPKSELEQAIVKATLALAKKQTTWFKRNAAIHWVGQLNQANILVKEYLRQ